MSSAGDWVRRRTGLGTVGFTILVLGAALVAACSGVSEQAATPPPPSQPNGSDGQGGASSGSGAGGRPGAGASGGNAGGGNAGSGPDAAGAGGASSTPSASGGADGGAPAGNTGGSGGRETPTPDPNPGPSVPLPAGGPSGTRDSVVVFLHIGHSNMAGRATNPADLKPYFYDTDPHLWSWHGSDPTIGSLPFKWSLAKEPLSPDADTMGMAGPGMAILHAALAIAKPDITFVSVGHGHSGMAGGYCRNYKKGGLLYDIMMKPAIALKGSVTFGGLFTMLGTTERHLDVNAQNGFSDCMAQIAMDVRGDLEAPDMPMMMSDFEMEATGDTSPDLPYAKIIIAQLREAVNKIPKSALIPTEKLGMEGSHHFNMAGHKEWGLRGVQIMKDKGWAPWAR